MTVIGCCIASFGVYYSIWFAIIGMFVVLFLPIGYLAIIFDAWLENLIEEVKKWIGK